MKTTVKHIWGGLSFRLDSQKNKAHVSDTISRNNLYTYEYDFSEIKPSWPVKIIPALKFLVVYLEQHQIQNSQV